MSDGAPEYSHRKPFERGSKSWNRTIKILSRFALESAAVSAIVSYEMFDVPIPIHLARFAELFALSSLAERVRRRQPVADRLHDRLEPSNDHDRPI